MAEILGLPKRMFACGEEPVGIRVTSYGPCSGIRKIMKVLEEEERAIIRESSFGKFVAIAEKAAYSGRFGRFIISRQLKVSKKREIWVLFYGHPIRFSLREFAIVTGLPCGKFPQKSRKKLKNNITETPYWSSLFGKLESVTVAAVIKMLERKTVTDKIIRVKYALLALLASVVMATTHQPKILKEHAEEIVDLEAFFKYPWGRLAFDMLIRSIKEKNEITLLQKSIAVKGFVHSLQLVMVEAVPALLEGVQVNSTSSSTSEGEEEEDGTREKTISLSSAHARDVHEEEKAVVDCIIPDDGEVELDETELEWTDEVEDCGVDNILRCIKEEKFFSSSMFVGGATKADVVSMIKEAKDQKAKGKGKQGKESVAVIGGSSCTGGGMVDNENELRRIVDLVSEKCTVDVQKAEGKLNETVVLVAELRSTLRLMESNIVVNVGNQISKMKRDVIDGITEFLGKGHSRDWQSQVQEGGVGGREDEKKELLPLSTNGTNKRNQLGCVGNCSEVGDNTNVNGGREQVVESGFQAKGSANPTERPYVSEGGGPRWCGTKKRRKTFRPN